MILDEVIRCDLQIQEPQYSSYRVSHALEGLETLGREYRFLQQNHFSFAKQVLMFLQHSGRWNDSPHLKQLRSAVKASFPNLLVSCPMPHCTALLSLHLLKSF